MATLPSASRVIEIAPRYPQSATLMMATRFDVLSHLGHDARSAAVITAKLGAHTQATSQLHNAL